MPHNLKLSQFIRSSHYDYEFLRRVLDHREAHYDVPDLYKNLDPEVKAQLDRTRKIQYDQDLRRFAREIEVSEARENGDEIDGYDFKHRKELALQLYLSRSAFHSKTPVKDVIELMDEKSDLRNSLRSDDTSKFKDNLKATHKNNPD